MARLLDVDQPAALDPDDLSSSLDAIDRLGEPGQSDMFESFIFLGSRFPEVSVPALVERLVRRPRAWSAGLAASTIREILNNVPDGQASLRREEVVPALIAAVEAGAPDPSFAAERAVGVLRDWTRREPLPEAGPAIAAWLSAATDPNRPRKHTLKWGREVLEANGQDSLLAEVRKRAAQLPADHPLRLALDGGRPG
jgi:hypothetical protein